MQLKSLFHIKIPNLVSRKKKWQLQLTVVRKWFHAKIAKLLMLFISRLFFNYKKPDSGFRRVNDLRSDTRKVIDYLTSSKYLDFTEKKVFERQLISPKNY